MQPMTIFLTALAISAVYLGVGLVFFPLLVRAFRGPNWSPRFPATNLSAVGAWLFWLPLLCAWLIIEGGAWLYYNDFGVNPVGSWLRRRS